MFQPTYIQFVNSECLVGRTPTIIIINDAERSAIKGLRDWIGDDCRPGRAVYYTEVTASVSDKCTIVAVFQYIGRAAAASLAAWSRLDVAEEAGTSPGED